MPESLPGATTALREELAQSEEGFAAARLTIAEMVGEKIQLEEALAAARRKQGELWELLREARLALVHWAETAEMPLLARIEAALAAPAAGRDPAIEGADAAWRDGEAHGRDK